MVMRATGFIAVYIFYTSIIFWQCRFVQREDYILSNEVPHRTGILKNYLFAGKPGEKVYPDLGLVLANAEILNLSDSQVSKIRKKAIECENLESNIKTEIKTDELNLKGRVAAAELKGDLTKLAPQLNRIEEKRRKWLKIHTLCYSEGLDLLTFPQKAEWLPIENLMEPLPAY